MKKTIPLNLDNTSFILVDKPSPRHGRHVGKFHIDRPLLPISFHGRGKWGYLAAIGIVSAHFVPKATQMRSKKAGNFLKQDAADDLHYRRLFKFGKVFSVTAFIISLKVS
jgi:hypothetical protein